MATRDDVVHADGMPLGYHIDLAASQAKAHRGEARCLADMIERRREDLPERNIEILKFEAAYNARKGEDWDREAERLRSLLTNDEVRA